MTRLVALRTKVNPSLVAKKKCDAGVPVSAFVKFAVVDGHSLSLSLEKTLKIENGQGSNTLRAFIDEKMMTAEAEFKELIVVG